MTRRLAPSARTRALQFQIAHETSSSDHSYPSGSRQDPKEAEGGKEERKKRKDLQLSSDHGESHFEG
jgi:hypothetical protein